MTVHYKRDPKNSSCSLLSDDQKEYLMRPLSDEYECISDYLKQVNSWSFPIFKFNDSTEHCLSLVSCKLCIDLLNDCQQNYNLNIISAKFSHIFKNWIG